MSKIKDKIKDKLPGNSEPEHKTEKEKLDERREEILSKGRKFKYPMQFAKHRLVIATVIIALVVLILTGILGWLSLYKTQNTGDVLYRITTILPVPVAKVDGEDVRYSDYLMIYRSSITPVEQQNGALSVEDNLDSLKNYYKRVALTSAEDYTYAIKLAKQLGIEVTDEMVDKAFDDHRKIGGTDRSQESFLKILKDNFNMGESEYRRMLYLSLVKTEVSRKIDTEATKKAEEALSKVKAGGEFRKVAEELSLGYEETGELVDILNIDGGRSDLAYNMTPGEISGILVSGNGDGYYIVKLVDKADSKVNYVSIQIPFTEFNNRLNNVREENRIEEYIEFPEEDAAEEQQ